MTSTAAARIVASNTAPDFKARAVAAAKGGKK